MREARTACAVLKVCTALTSRCLRHTCPFAHTRPSCGNRAGFQRRNSGKQDWYLYGAAISHRDYFLATGDRLSVGRAFISR